MPYPKGHRERVRTRILGSARKLFNLYGFEAVSIDAVMEDAGLTRGGFYAHFRSKAQLYAEAVAFILEDQHPAHNWPGVDFDLSTDPARKIINAYLSRQHCDDIEGSCPLVTQASSAPRGDRDAREAYRRVLAAMTNIFTQSKAGEIDRSERGLAIAALCVGGLALARGVGDRELADRIREASRKAALELGGWDVSSPTRKSSQAAAAHRI